VCKPMLKIDRKEGSLWTPVSVRPRCEKIVAQYACGIGLTHYLPLRRRMARYQRRNVETFLPMFPGYLFVQMGQSDAEQLVRCNKIARILRMDENLERQLISELQSLVILENSSLEAELVVSPELIEGALVEVVTGPFRGMLGIVEKREKSTRISVNVDMLGQSVSVDLDIGEVAQTE